MEHSNDADESDDDDDDDDSFITFGYFLPIDGVFFVKASCNDRHGCVESHGFFNAAIQVLQTCNYFPTTAQIKIWSSVNLFRSRVLARTTAVKETSPILVVLIPYQLMCLLLFKAWSISC